MSTMIMPFPDGPSWMYDIQLDGAVYTIKMAWNTRFESWIMGIALSNGTELVNGIRLVINWSLLHGADYNASLPPGAFMVIDPNGALTRDPGREDFSEELMQLVYVEAADLG